MRLRISYRFPSLDSTGIPPCNHSGPLTLRAGSSTTPMAGASLFSMGLWVLLSYTTRRPAGQWLASRMMSLRVSGLSGSRIRPQIMPPGSQKRANAQRPSTSSRRSASPCVCSAWRWYGRREAVSVPSKRAFVWLPSQKGLVSELPQRHSAYDSPTLNDLPGTQSQENPSALGVMVWIRSGTPPVTMNGPSLEMTTRFSPCFAMRASGGTKAVESGSTGMAKPEAVEMPARVNLAAGDARPWSQRSSSWELLHASRLGSCALM